MGKESKHYKAVYFNESNEVELADYGFCAESVAVADANTGRTIQTQCQRGRGHGPDGAFCKQHARGVESE